MKKEILNIITNKMTREHPQNVKNDWQLKRGTKEAEILNVKLSGRWGIKKYRFKSGEEINIDVIFKTKGSMVNPHFGIAIFRHDYTYCYGPNTLFDNISIERLGAGRGRFSIEYPEFLLLPGEYYISAAIWNPDEKNPYDYHCACCKFYITGKERDALYKEIYVYKHDMFNRKHSKTVGDGVSLMLLNKYGDEKQIFETDKTLNFILEYDNKDSLRLEGPFKICREDGILCFKISDFNGRRHSQDSKKLRIEIPRLHLLSGVYHVYLGDKKIREFLVHSGKQDHGIVYMPHKWSLSLP